ncbi:hypothetical protein T07_4010 [Trichinella nelsoni]|uniref:Uncharacterized protein n=1 Tax=Trichinella nelsoni TaxID=6336 RepID=A0A0V0RCJ2_9BILA|nr:hypothetical protein T07_4010 [Trichinella nelsoni]
MTRVKLSLRRGIMLSIIMEALIRKYITEILLDGQHGLIPL